MSATVLIVDDQRLFAEGLEMLVRDKPGLVVVAKAYNGNDAIELALKHQPQLILMDVFMNGLNGIEAVRSIRATLKSVRILAISSFAEREPVLQMLNAGANGYVLKANAFTELSFAIDAVLRGNTFLSPEVAGLVVQGALDPTRSFATGSPLDVLTPREREVLQLLCEDHVPKDIALRLGISRKTVDVHKRNLMEKLGVNSSAGLFRVANREGLI
jgi:DNA-binding NarL/FixJ family response regulator